MKRLFLVLLLLSTQAFAKDSTSDFQAWVPININVKLTDDIRGFLEIQPRIGHDLTSLDTGIVRPALGWKLADNWTIWGGYAMQSQRNSTTNDYEIENRSWEGITYRTKGTSGNFELRNRVEQRFLPHNHDISHRWRLRARAEYLFSSKSTWSLISSSEVFVNLNDNDVNQNLQSGMNQVRSYLGVGYRFNPSAQVESGYLHQHVFNSSPTTLDQDNNIWMTSLNLNF